MRTKEELFKYIGAEDSIYGHSRSYKLVLFKILFADMWKGKKSYVYDVASKFKDFYVKRIAEGKIPDKDADERIERANLSSTKDILNIYRERIIEYRSRFGDTEFYKNFLKYDLDEKQWQQALKDLALTMPCFLPNQRMNAQEEETLKE